jgi:hypothetical protein
MSSDTCGKWDAIAVSDKKLRPVSKSPTLHGKMLESLDVSPLAAAGLLSAQRTYREQTADTVRAECDGEPNECCGSARLCFQRLKLPNNSDVDMAKVPTLAQEEESIRVYEDADSRVRCCPHVRRPHRMERRCAALRCQRRFFPMARLALSIRAGRERASRR